MFKTTVPDEEVGGGGMGAFISSALYKSLPGIALALDEGLASTDDTYSLFYGERLPWWIDVTATGNTGHGSRFIDGTAGELCSIHTTLISKAPRTSTQSDPTQH